MFPVRCYTCNALVAHVHPAYREAVLGRRTAPAAALEALRVERLCCRRMFLGHVDLVADQLAFPNVDRVLDGAGTVLKRHAAAPRVVSCD